MYASTDSQTPATSTSPCATTTRLWPHALYVDLAVRRDYSSPAARALRRPRRAPRLLVSGRTRSTSTLPCAATTRLRPCALYVNLPVRRDYSSPAASAMPCSVTTHYSAAQLYVNLAVRRGYSSPGCSGSTSTMPHARVPRPVTRLVAWLVAPLVVDYFAYAVHSGCLGMSCGPLRGSSSTTPCAATSSCGHAGSTSATPCTVTTCLAATLALLRVRRAQPQHRLPVASRRSFISTSFLN
jgi:hypothetical protein